MGVMRRGVLTAAALATIALLGVARAAAAGPLEPVVAAHPTGRWLVAFRRPGIARSASLLSDVLARTGARRAGRGVPALGIATVTGPALALRELRRDSAVESVSREWARPLRRQPNDPALSTPETDSGGLPGGAPIQWALARERFPAAWDVTTGDGAVVGLVDTGIDGSHPELARKIASADAVGTSSPLTDSDGHGTHVAGLACATTNNSIGIAGAGWGCRLAVVKLGEDQAGVIRDEDIVAGIRLAVDRGAKAVNMSFGGGGQSAALSLAIDYAVAHNVVLVSAAANDPTTDQGAPASQLQPNDSPNIDAGRGLVVTAADFGDTSAGTGSGPQISLAAYGFADDPLGPPGLISTYPGNATPREGIDGLFGCGCRAQLGGDYRYAYLEGTSMATPQVAALAALVGNLNPWLTLHEKLRLIKESARRSGGWSPQLGWGILDAGHAIEAARRIDHLAPSSRLRARRRVRLRRGRRAAVRLRLTGGDPAGRPGLIPSGLRSFDVYLKSGRGRYRRIRRGTAKRSTLVRLRPGVYRLYTIALDRAGNRERAPRRADVRLTVAR
jgi:serine protease